MQSRKRNEIGIALYGELSILHDIFALLSFPMPAGAVLNNDNQL